MKIVVERKTGNVKYMFENYEEIVFEEHMVKPLRALDIKPETHYVISGVERPELWAPDVWKYSSGWVVANADLYAAALENEKEKKIKAIKDEAAKRILAIAPEWKQRNLIARSVEITRAKIDGTATAEEIKEGNAIQAIWDSVKAIRDKSDALEAEILADGLKPVVWPD